MTYQCANPAFFELQCRTLEAFCNDDYEFVVFDDAQNPTFSQGYQQLCTKYNARYYRVDQKIHTYAYQKREPWNLYNNASVRNSSVVEYSLRLLGREHDDYVFLLDGDLVPVKPFSVREMMEDSDVLGIRHSRRAPDDPKVHLHYLWIGFVILDMPNLPEKSLIDFNCGQIDGIPVDAGGYSCLYLRKYQDTLRFKYINSGRITSELIDSHEMATPFSIFLDWNVGQVYSWNFLHYCGASNWRLSPEEYHRQKWQLFSRFVNDQIDRYASES